MLSTDDMEYTFIHRTNSNLPLPPAPILLAILKDLNLEYFDMEINIDIPMLEKCYPLNKRQNTSHSCRT